MLLMISTAGSRTERKGQKQKKHMTGSPSKVLRKTTLHPGRGAFGYFQRKV
jgi:hypothetical protein